LTLGHIFAKPKDSIKTNPKTHAVYFIPFGDCEKEYFGQSNHALNRDDGAYLPEEYMHLIGR
jgi:hypothetical protein